MSQNEYIIRCDSSAIIGSGHLMRCLNLARRLVKKHAKITFLCRDLPGSFHKRVEDGGFDLILIPTEKGDKDYSITQKKDAESVLSVIQSRSNTTLIVDHYALTIEWQKHIRPHTRLVVVDDLADRPHDCDILINQNYYPEGIKLYDGLIPESASLYMGPSYAMIAESFAAYYKTPTEPSEHKNRVVIFFGGSDLSNLSKTAALSAINSALFDRIDLIAGQNHPDIFSLKELTQTNNNIHIHTYIENFAHFLSGANLMIGAGGSTQLERCCLGVPGIIVSIADNQTTISRNLEHLGTALYLGWHENITTESITTAINSLYKDTHIRQRMSTNSENLVDGLGGERVACLLTLPEIGLRHARICDASFMHNWRNHASVREHSGNPKKITLESHLAWLERTLADENKILLIAQIDGTPCGVLRFDLQEEKAVISVYLDPKSIGQGIGYGLLHKGREWLQERHPRIKLLQASIHDRNARSLKTFIKAGYRKRDDFYELDI